MTASNATQDGKDKNSVHLRRLKHSSSDKSGTNLAIDRRMPI